MKLGPGPESFIAFNAIIEGERKVNADWLTVMSNLLRLSKAGLPKVEGPRLRLGRGGSLGRVGLLDGLVATRVKN